MENCSAVWFLVEDSLNSLNESQRTRFWKIIPPDLLLFWVQINSALQLDELTLTLKITRALANCKETSNKRKITNKLRKKAYKSRQNSSQLQRALSIFHGAQAFLTSIWVSFYWRFRVFWRFSFNSNIIHYAKTCKPNNPRKKATF